MKALSLNQPWADLIVNGKKTIETRKWKTNFRGEFYIHSSMKFDGEYCKKFNIIPVTGAILGKAELIDIKEYKNKEDFEKDNNKHFAKNIVRYGFILKNARRITPIKYKGKLNFFEVK